MKKGFGVLGILAIGTLGMASALDPALGWQARAQESASSSARAQAGQTSATATTTNSRRAGQTAAVIASGTAMNASLNAPVDSKKAKAGDTVIAHTTEAVKADGKTVIPKGTKLVGHVTQASTKAKGESQSTLAVVFDKAILKDGQEMPINASIQALAAAQSPAHLDGSDLDPAGGSGVPGAGSAAAGGRGTMGGVGATAGGVTNAAARTTSGAVGAATTATADVARTSEGATGGVNSDGQLTLKSRGVFGLEGLNLSAAGSNDAQGTVITSKGKNVHLDGGTQMLLVAGTAAGAAQNEPKKSDGAKPEPKSQPRQR